MWRDLRVDFVGPPFAGHLFPLLELGRALKGQGMRHLRVFSTASALPAIQASGLEGIELLKGAEDTVMAIANPDHQVGSNPLRMYRQFKMNVSLMIRMRDELERHWRERQPDLVLADFTVPVGGLTAQRLGIPWWTSMPTPCAMETGDGTPSYLGGWMPRDDWFGRIRDRCGWGVIRTFKRAIGILFARQLRELSISSVYRSDRLEVAYSPQRILGLGMREFEFPRSWPDHFAFVGPLTAAPSLPHEPPEFTPGKRHVLITLGTHVMWARRQAVDLIRATAAQLDDCVFHFSHGKPGGVERTIDGNMHFYDGVPYNTYLPRYDAVVMHGGTGITYACIKAGVPTVVWPRDYDQFDHAARVQYHKLGLRFHPGRDCLAAQLRSVLDDDSIRVSVQRFQHLSRNYDACSWLCTEIKSLAETTNLRKKTDARNAKRERHGSISRA